MRKQYGKLPEGHPANKADDQAVKTKKSKAKKAEKLKGDDNAQ